MMAGVKSIERRPCAICKRVTLHTVTKSKNGMGKTLAEDVDCRDHEVWSNGGIDVRDPRSGEWRTVRPPRREERLESPRV
jgi:hypothetical protein